MTTLLCHQRPLFLLVNQCLNDLNRCNSSRIVKKMSSSLNTGKKLIAVCQLSCKDNKDENFGAGERLIREAVSHSCAMVFLPECFDMICESRKAVLDNLEPLEGEIVSKYRKLASECKVWLSLGGLHEKVPGAGKLTQ